MANSDRRWLMTEIGKPLVKESFTPPAPAENEVTVEVAGCGVCHTDLGFLYDGVPTKHELPLTLGHEISGRVVSSGAGAEVLEGKSVIVPAVIPCGACDLCQRGLGNICRTQKMPGNDIQGGFASHINVPSYGLCTFDESRLADIDMTLADVSVIADAVTTPYQAIKLAEVQAGDVVIVIGIGGVGGYAVQIAHAMGATVVAIDIDQEKLDKLGEYGATLTINANEAEGSSLKKQILAFAKENGLRTTEWKIFECSGSAAGQLTAFGLLTFGAHLAIVGFTLAKSEVRLSNLMAFNARVQGNWGCLPEYYPAVLELVLTGKIQMKPFIKQHPLDDINDVFTAVHAHKMSERAIMVP
jgi:6-hydroxycyclohex-1-ene-1-carbonyl-CoA dehydrogenase